MTISEYKEYQERFNAGMEGITSFSSGRSQSCDECYNCDCEPDECECPSEPSFAKDPCEICITCFGGDSYDAHGLIDGNIVHIQVCEDCLYYAEYGRLDDTTMESMEL